MNQQYKLTIDTRLNQITVKLESEKKRHLLYRELNKPKRMLPKRNPTPVFVRNPEYAKTEMARNITALKRAKSGKEIQKASFIYKYDKERHPTETLSKAPIIDIHKPRLSSNYYEPLVMPDLAMTSIAKFKSKQIPDKKNDCKGKGTWQVRSLGKKESLNFQGGFSFIKAGILRDSKFYQQYNVEKTIKDEIYKEHLNPVDLPCTLEPMEVINKVKRTKPDPHSNLRIEFYENVIMPNKPLEPFHFYNEPKKNKTTSKIYQRS